MITDIFTNGRTEGEKVRIRFLDVCRYKNSPGLFLEMNENNGQCCYIELTPEIKRFLLGVLLAEIQERKGI